MPDLVGMKLTAGPPVVFDDPDGSPYPGEPIIWKNRTAPGTVELWMLGAIFVFTRTGDVNGIYTLQPGSSSNALEIYDDGTGWSGGTTFYLTAAAPPFPIGLPFTDGYNYVARVTDTGQNITIGSFSTVSGSADVWYFNILFGSKPLSAHVFTVRFYYQHYGPSNRP